MEFCMFAATQRTKKTVLSEHPTSVRGQREGSFELGRPQSYNVVRYALH